MKIQHRRFWGIAFLALSLLVRQPTPARAETESSVSERPYWTSFQPRLGGGLFAVLPSSGPIRISPMIELGIEKGWKLSESFYLGVDLTWTVFFPDSFQDQMITISNTVVAPWVLLLTPIPHIHFGYITSENLLITIGPAYLWGLTATVRKPLTETTYLAAEGTWFFDRILFNTGLHDFYVNFLFGLRL